MLSDIDTLAASSRSEVQRHLSEAIPDTGEVGFLMQNVLMRNDHFDWRLNLASLGASLPALGNFPAPLLSAAGAASSSCRANRACRSRPR